MRLIALDMTIHSIRPKSIPRMSSTPPCRAIQQGKAIPREAIMTPGEPEGASRAKRAKSGVPLPDETWTSIVAAARSVGVNRDLSF